MRRNPKKVIEVLIRNEIVLNVIDDTGVTIQEVVAATGDDVETARNKTNQLEHHGLIIQDGDTYTRSVLGQYLLEDFYKYRSENLNLFRSSSLLEDIEESNKINRAIIDGGDVTISTDRRPNKAIEATEQVFLDATELRVTFSEYNERLIDAIADQSALVDDATVVIYQNEIRETSDELLEAAEELFAIGIQVQKSTEEIEYTSFIAKDGAKKVAGILFCQEDSPSGVIMSDDEEAIRFIDQRIERIESHSDPVSGNEHTADSTS